MVVDVVIVAAESVDSLGRVLPAKSVRLEDVGGLSPREINGILGLAAQNGRKGEYNRIVHAAWQAGCYYGPPDLAGRCCPFRIWQ